MTAGTYKSSRGPFVAIFAAFSILTMGSVLLLNLQPWFALGRDFTSQIDTGPLLGLADWLIGGRLATVLGLALCILAIRMSGQKFKSASLGIAGLIFLLRPGTLIQILGEMFGFLMWGWIQFVQVSPMLAEHSLIPKSQKWMVQLKRYRVAAYAAEMIACFIKYPPYAGGDLTRLITDLQAFSPDPYLWSWANFGWAAFTMCAVEMVLIFLLKAGVYSGAFVKTAKTKEPTKKQANPHQGTNYKVYR